MTRSELIDRLTQLQVRSNADTYRKVNTLIEDIQSDGVLDVQAPRQIAVDMGLPQPKED